MNIIRLGKIANYEIINMFSDKKEVYSAYLCGVACMT